MSRRHQAAHAALAAIHGSAASILALESAIAHAACALAAALIYALLAWDRGDDGDGKTDG